MKSVLKKILKIVGIILLVLLALALFLFFLGRPKSNTVWGVTFSTIRAEELGFKPEELFKQILADLHPQKIRLPAYWSEIEPQQNQFDFKAMDALLADAEKSGSKIVLVLGNKEPRWPECHAPLWYSKLNPTDRDAALLKMMGQAVTHFKNSPAISEWQLENEPFFQYGPDCPAIPQETFSKELSVIRNLDSRPVIATDSGEKGVWVTVARSGVDVLGATMYREVYYEKQAKYVTYPMPWWLYNIKAGLVKLLSGKDVIGVELQAEPWLVISNPKATPPDEQLTHMNAEIFDRDIKYASHVGFSENYLWGVEWWYWMQKTNHNDSVLNEAKKLFNK